MPPTENNPELTKGKLEMKRTVLVVSLLLFIMSFVVITREHVHAAQDEDTANKDSSSINSVLKTIINELGNSRSSVVTKMVKPLFMSSEFIINPNDPLHDNRIYTPRASGDPYLSTGQLLSFFYDFRRDYDRTPLLPLMR